MVTPLLIAALLGAGSSGLTIVEGKKAPPPKKLGQGDLGILPMNHERVDVAEILGALEVNALRLAEHAELKPVAGEALAERLGGLTDVEICGSKIKCLARLGRRAKLHFLLYGEATSTTRPMAITFTLIRVRGARLMRTTDVLVGSVLDANDVMVSAFPEIFGMPLPERALTPSAGVPTEPVAIPGNSEIAASPAAPVVDPAQPPPGPASDEDGIDARSVLDRMTPTAAPRRPPPKPKKPSHWLMYTGIGMGAVGAGLLAGGVVVGMDARSIKNELEPNTPQPEASAIARRHNDQAKKANLLLGTGIGIAAAGVTMIVLDLILVDSPKPTSRVEAGDEATSSILPWLTPQGAGGAYTLRF